MYSPKIRDDLIPRLYQAKQKLKRPMTRLASEAVEVYLDQIEKENLMSLKKTTDETPVPTPTDGQTLEATIDLFYLTPEGLESHLQIKASNTLYALAESNIAVQSILAAGGRVRTFPNGKNGKGSGPAAPQPYFVDDEGAKRCNRQTTDGEKCGEPVTSRKGQYGNFWSCPNYKNHVKENHN